LDGTSLREDVLNLLAARRGHFLFESGHHGDLWLDLELLCLQPSLLRPLTAELAARMQPFGAEVICGPLIEGAFVALLVASELNVQFAYSERFARSTRTEFFPAGYRIPAALHGSVRQKRVAIVNDVINAGSAVRGTFEDLENCGAIVVAIGALLVLGNAAKDFAEGKGVALENLAALPNNLWNAATCPLCASSVPLQDVSGFRTTLGGALSAH
jgi:orotate phosphoribosyltransferase